ncbi:tyrosine-type recombinase/integrase [Yersinia enterocolitica]|nr:tyrosine-type recombinase/integrase [Yersinia enterocolitica]
MLQNLKNLQENQYSVFETKNYSLNVRFSDSKWRISESIILNVDSLASIDSFFMEIKTTLAYFAMNYSASYTKRMFYAIKHYIKTCRKIKLLFSIDCIRFYYKTISPLDYTHAESIKYFFIKVNSLYPSVFSRDTITFIVNVRIDKRYIGKNIKTHDYKRGPFSDLQMKEILDSTAKAYKEEKISLSNYLLLILLAYSGRRPMQIAQLEAGDLFSLNGMYYINAPRIKQRNGYRKEFSKIQIPEDMFNHLTYLTEAVSSLVSETLNLDLSEKQKNELPIFLNTYPFKKGCVELSMIENGMLKLTPYAITRKIRSTIISSTNKSKTEIGCINSRRFRYSLGTKAAQFGYSPSIIANILDHSSTTSVMSYVENTAENGRKINEAVNELMKPLANMFIGGNNLERELDSLKNIIDECCGGSESISFDRSAISLVNDYIDDLINSI